MELLDAYLAVPYTHDNPNVRDQRYKRVTEYATHLIKQGKVIYSPITTTHALIKFAPDIGTQWGFWKKFDSVYIPFCRELHILTMIGWRESVGVTEEKKMFKALKRPIIYVDPIDFSTLDIGALDNE